MEVEGTAIAAHSVPQTFLLSVSTVDRANAHNHLSLSSSLQVFASLEGGQQANTPREGLIACSVKTSDPPRPPSRGATCTTTDGGGTLIVYWYQFSIGSYL
uniref:Uncharacterized protein n=1 Tax=Eutreptiella gymnastica TaxID=73025 RepID=A0A6U7UQS9_9EUGL|mmetsp:Transcript_125708/g.217965  ORF Transcript_125708/g.217965 Transcript_125708/m.217965 type:complete len:101 (+) Transcript_125708:1123-1425(+)